jgi:hypothetical protein
MIHRSRPDGVTTWCRSIKHIETDPLSIVLGCFLPPQNCFYRSYIVALFKAFVESGVKAPGCASASPLQMLYERTLVVVAGSKDQLLAAGYERSAVFYVVTLFLTSFSRVGIRSLQYLVSNRLARKLWHESFGWSTARPLKCRDVVVRFLGGILRAAGKDSHIYRRGCVFPVQRLHVIQLHREAVAAFVSVTGKMTATL